MKHITITGDLGSGKSAVSRILAEKLNGKTLSTGYIQRNIAARYNMTTLELNKYTETHPEIDDIIDNELKKTADSNDLHIIDSRLAWFFIPDSFKVYLSVDIQVAAERIREDSKRITETYDSSLKAAAAIADRKKSENKRYLSYYGANCADMNNFDLIVDTSSASPEEVAEAIIKGYDKWKLGC
ncbi:cytidylate kinase [Bacteroidales bacterium Barb7]|nr:cytidylate kinase [Bacteroidales bacterium Barb7]